MKQLKKFDKVEVNLNEICKQLNSNFGAPYLDKILVKFEVEESEEGDILNITIDRRDIQMSFNGEVISAGTFM